MSPRRRRQENPESSGAAPGAEQHEATGIPEEFDLPENVEYFSQDNLHGKAVLTLKDRANRMLDEAIGDPNSEANQLVRILLLNQVANMQPESFQKDPRLTLTEERHRGLESDRKAELDKHRVKYLQRHMEKLKEEIKLVGLREKDLEQKVKERERKLEEARRLAQNAQAAAEHGQPLDELAVYRRISEIIGLRSPAEEEAAARSPET